MVGDPGRDIRRVVGICGVRHVGGISERALHIWTVLVAVLFASALCVARGYRWSRARVVRRQAGLDPGLPAVFSGAVDPSIPRSLPVHLLLLPRRLLQIVLGGPAGVR